MPKKKIITESSEEKKETKKIKEKKPSKAKPILIEKGKADATLIITEKPQAALKISSALSDGKDKKYSDAGVPFYEFEHNGKKFIVGCAVGHLFGIGQKEGTKGEFPNFNVEWKPNFENKDAAYTKRYFDLLKKLSKRANEFIIATDYDVEGEVIGWNVLRFLANKQDAKRMKFSSLTKDELLFSFEHLSQHLNWGQALAGESRHYIDWFYGINLSRGLMKALSKTGKFRILSIGRVQGPALSLVVEKELEIKKFKPEPFWQIFLQIQDLNKKKAEVKYHQDVFKEAELTKFKHLKGKKAQAKTEIKDDEIFPPLPFDLTTLQTEAYAFCGLSPTQSLQTAQKLYLEGLISYPRTSSQEYPEAIGYEKILKSLSKYTQLTKYAVNKKPTKGKKTDPAHPAIYPTGEIKKDLEGAEKKLYELILKRFISCFAESAKVETKKLEVEIDGLKFSASGLQIKDKGWMNVYPSRTKEEKLETINGQVDIKELRIEEKQTQPPRRFTQASLIKELEKRNLGTKSTRASIIETLISRGYVKGQSIEATSLGIKMIDTLKKYSPIIIDENLTKEMEEEMEEMQTSQKDLEKKEHKIIEDAKKAITLISKDMIKHEEKIGEGLAEATQELRKEERQENTLSLCPVCKKGHLRIAYNRNSKRYFIACNAYPDCKTTFSLPPNSLIRPALKTKKEISEIENKEENEEHEEKKSKEHNHKDKEKKEKTREDIELCKECHFPMLLAIRKGKRPWKFCFNPNCPTNAEWQKKREEYQKEHPPVPENKEEKKKEK
jgi:DNA topoisomerase-1